VGCARASGTVEASSGFGPIAVQTASTWRISASARASGSASAPLACWFMVEAMLRKTTDDTGVSFVS
jgi:hypothetical protein